ncbi:UDP-N-acetylmuramoyl-L-alanyl-D-glutamate--2,6-diaminopimelate ligase [Paraburkholderia tropica]|uniref:UDP-N-acetylmuramoyl-L-alanyl-D-glutamate--2,6-diaminopimelate ligase n=1 Tax=Paraburkholderia tropica TaxID=92647 RepID=A0A1A5XDC2_9BURK|nr:MULTISPECIES: UDP-N-acetylmuramoyl-L-alanyl-D-glutamate--2,6-diaminopimelate ligase [Paraburkholderia]MBB2982956.1 UDP-N-acetylmuramoyl-L-alanyl-D-glutamate--2,6-diaminopimelate ligase [Paraburkholderia tropica]MBB3004510.1 UDP-N-acetylmuramoyl-L-alanyl-D-glutamate--2,6-diaminopimelate ligase [Paraburkholderia tropica]MBB6323560.1 UDP-N-acetylmuramoyl-L-alanyl-D-glutamate--2,6-diaminopimelate ligase [Paraburkholderia tropica]OBR51324.1 UDP-N-acetylmuramoyl-L-alanyl-D-glutamate--2,6-diaminopi
MSATRNQHPAHRQIADALAWLRARIAPAANLHADTRSLQPGDVFLAYAVEGADNRPHIESALARGAAAVVYQPEGYAGTFDFSQAQNALAVPQLDVVAGEIASGWYGDPSDAMLVVGVTGTNGKTSCSQWIASALTAIGQKCAIVGTLGSGFVGQLVHTGFTTPDAPQLQRSLAQLQQLGAKAVAMEVSSHALHQGRVNGTSFDIAVFTNLTQDHLDYHRTFEAYEAAKARLFAWPGLRAAVINADDAAGRRLIAATRGTARTIAYGVETPAADAPAADAWLRATNVRATATGTAFHLETSDWGEANVEVQTLGLFNVSNLLGVLGALLAANVPLLAALNEIAKLQPVNGRMERLGGRTDHDEPLVVIDYAHTPDALEKTLDALRPIAAARGGQLICMFGCGGDRDATKRPLMGAIAERLADQVVVTSDNPRSESPTAIIDQIVGGMREAAKARRIEDRASAILQAVRGAAKEDVIVLAGKGHEATQEIMGKKRAFSDQDHARLALAARPTSDRHGRGGGE